MLDGLIERFSTVNEIGTTMTQVSKELADEELAEEKRGDIQLHEVSRTTFLRVGLELEEQQYVVN